MTTTATRPAATRPSPRRPPSRWRLLTRPVRMLWRRLTSMRTALILLFLLALAAVPGSLLPQRPLNPTKVDTYLAHHGWWGRFLDHLGFFDVFGSVWFSAVYILLAISLVGCLVPRLRVYTRALRTKPLPAPKNLARLPENGEFTVTGDVSTVASKLTRQLGRRWRTITRDEDGGVAVSAEKGYSREAGNLVFHIALLGALAAIAIGRLYGYEGSVILQEGGQFCNTPVALDSLRTGRLVDEGNLAPFCIDDLRKFTATYTSDGEARRFAADVTYSKGADGPGIAHTITVNHPLRLEGDRVYLINHGFAPTVTVHYPDGRSITQTASFIPQNSQTYYSEGAFEIQGPKNAQGDYTNGIGIAGYFAPVPAFDANGLVTSVGPVPKNPVLGVRVFTGDVGNDGQPRSVYSLDQAQIASGKLKQVAQKDLEQGESVTLPDKTTVTFDGYKQWVAMQVSHDPAQKYLLIFAVLMVVGLIGSLAVRRRRLWLRLRSADDPDGPPSAASRTVVQVGGLARSDSGNFTDEFRAVLAMLRDGPPVEDPPDRQED